MHSMRTMSLFSLAIRLSIVMGARSREMAGLITVMSVTLIFIPSVPWKKTKMILWQKKIPKKAGSVMGKSASKLDSSVSKI